MNEYIVAQVDAEIRLDRWFKRHLPHITHGIIEKALRKGQIKLNGKKAESSARIEAGHIITIHNSILSAVPQRAEKRLPKPDEHYLTALKKSVLYEDDMMMILNKPTGLAVQGGSGQLNHVDGLLRYLGKEGEGALKLVHRLDKDTSGVLMLAKGSKSASLLSRLFAQKEVEKNYLALVVGVPSPAKGRIDLPLIKEARGRNSAMAVYEKVEVNEEEGQYAITQYRVLDALGKKLAWVELIPITGRTHQLRVHMASIGCPIIGDGKYGGPDVFMKELGLSPVLHLHAQQIIIPNWKGKRIHVTAPLPKHMAESKKLLGE